MKPLVLLVLSRQLVPSPHSEVTYQDALTNSVLDPAAHHGTASIRTKGCLSPRPALPLDFLSPTIEIYAGT